MSKFSAALGDLKGPLADLLLKLASSNVPMTAGLIQSEILKEVKNPTAAMVTQIQKVSSDIATVLGDCVTIADLIATHNATQVATS